MKKCILLVILLLLASMTVQAMVAVTETGDVIKLKEDGTWEYKCVHSTVVETESVLSEPKLFELAINNNEGILWEQYLEHYEGRNVKNTLIALYNYELISVIRIPPDKHKEILLKGVAYSEKLGEYFKMLTLGPMGPIPELTNLYFYWSLGQFYERQKDFTTALTWYEKLKSLYIETGQKHNFGYVLNNNLETIEGKIYTVKLKIK